MNTTGGRRSASMNSINELPSLIFDQVSALVATERAIEEAIDRQADVMLSHPLLHASLRAIEADSRDQRRTLEDHLRGQGVEPAADLRLPITRLLADPPREPVRVVSTFCAACSFAVTEYSALIELALRLYEPNLREIAPRHLSTYTKALRLLTCLCPSVVVGELHRQGQDCRCICPMCSIGICGCTAAGRSWINEFLARS